MPVNIFALLCNHHTIKLQNFFMLPKWNTISSKYWYPILSLSPAPDNHHSTFYLCDYDYSRNFLEEESHICPLVTGLFHLAWCLQGLSMLQPVLKFPSILKLKMLYCMYMPHFFYPAICWWTFVCFYLLAIVNNVAMNMGIQIPVWIAAFTSFECMLKSRIVGSYDNSV